MFIRHQFQWKTENMSKKRCLQHQIGMPSVWCWFKPAGTNRWVIRELLNSPSQQNKRRGLAISIHHVKILTVLIAKGNIQKLRSGFFASRDTKGGGGVRAGEKRTRRFFKKVFFQKPYRIILGPPKHVLHLVWSVLGIYTAIKTALKVAPTGSSKWSINGKVKHYN